jgi:dihydrofolate reductase
MRISLISALADNRVIGIHNRLPWKLPADMKWFRQHTLGKPIIMGRKTFESFGARPLPDRLNIVITHDQHFVAAGARVAHGIDAALRLAGDVAEVMVIGGESFYRQMLPRAERLYLTFVHAEPEGDAWFPAFDPEQWRETLRSEHPIDDKNALAMSFVILDRLR